VQSIAPCEHLPSMCPAPSADVVARPRLVEAQALDYATVKGAANSVALATRTPQSAAGRAPQGGSPRAVVQRRARPALRPERLQAQGVIVRGARRGHKPALALALALDRSLLNGVVHRRSRPDDSTFKEGAR
jgi:hypothetical protein